jgi:hypothetical protein
MTDSYLDSQLMLVPHTYQGALISQRATDGYINATAMCRAAGKEWSAYRRNDTTEAFLGALEGSLQIHRDLIVQSITAGANEARGTWIHPQVAIHLAQWLSPEFAVKVTEWVYEWMSGKHPSDKIWAQFQDRVSLVYDNVPDGYFCVFREIADVFAALISNGCNPGTKMLLDISVGMHWANHWKSVKLAEKFGDRRYFDHFYPQYFAQSYANPQPAACYPEDALPTFRRWLRDVYVQHKMPTYLKTQVQQKKLPAEIANNALAALAAREAQRALPRAIK